MNNIPEITSDKFVEFQITEVVDPDSYLFHEIYRLWPLDIKPSSTEFETELLKNRSKTGAMCFAMLHNNKLIGANWLYPPNQYYLSFSIPFLPGEYVSTGTFIVPGYRGMGASKFLKISGLNIAKQKGILSVISMSSVKNVPSVKMNLAT
ncbi:MAG: hypothetical protein P8016_07160, partial [Sedimentisphaerales bacterium]